MLVFYLAIGILMTKKGWLKESGFHSLSILLTTFSLPCAVFNSFQMPFSEKVLKLIMNSLGVAIIFFAGLFILSYFFCKVIRLSQTYFSTWLGCCSFSSILFIGIPIVNALFGQVGLIILVSFNTIGNLFFFGFGESVFSGKLDISIRKIILTPAILAAMLGMLLFLLKIELPPVVITPIQKIGDMTTPVAMIINGCLLSEKLSIKLFLNRDSWLFCFLRLIIIPLILISIFKVFISNPLLLSIVSLVSCMPSGSVNSVYAEKYAAQGSIASEFIVMSTLLSIFTIPVILNVLL